MVMLRLAAGAALLGLFGVGPETPASTSAPVANGASLSTVVRAYLHAEQSDDIDASNALIATDRRNCPGVMSLRRMTAVVMGEPFTLVTRREGARWHVEPQVRNIDGDMESGGSDLYVVSDSGQYRVC
jgi:hypothetical protein